MKIQGLLVGLVVAAVVGVLLLMVSGMMVALAWVTPILLVLAVLFGRVRFRVYRS